LYPQQNAASAYCNRGLTTLFSHYKDVLCCKYEALVVLFCAICDCKVVKDLRVSIFLCVPSKQVSLKKKAWGLKWRSESIQQLSAKCDDCLGRMVFVPDYEGSVLDSDPVGADVCHEYDRFWFFVSVFFLFRNISDSPPRHSHSTKMI
jgi:hypothetical protein